MTPSDAAPWDAETIAAARNCVDSLREAYRALEEITIRINRSDAAGKRACNAAVRWATATVRAAIDGGD